MNKLSPYLHRFLGIFGFDIIRANRSSTNEPITGSFPPYLEHSLVGRAENYFIHDGYRPQKQAVYYDDTGNKDEWQDEVYEFAREVFDQEQLKSVCDVGCGSAYKLLKYFKEERVIGLDVPETCVWLKKRYPNLTWMELDFRNPPALQADLTIAADIVEHLLDPDELLCYLMAIGSKYLVLSTPDRNLLRARTHNGPPRNPAHVREWSFAEFEAYVANRFQVVEHFISNSAQATQCVLCTPLHKR